ncbi:MAG: hypothetical protein EPO47_09460 [Rugosibacter sp.]|nr:MAG: hypothetical protein EPO60_06950 [Rugosibacter sp.]TBR08069.1 MAG: hypothetical protein EPO47_09460 [Rugosibacter sp.]
MAKIELLELEAHREQLTADLKQMVEKYRSIFECDVPDIEEPFSDKLILAAMRQALGDIKNELKCS